MNQAEQILIGALFSEGTLEYFELTKVEEEDKEFQIYLEEKNIAPKDIRKMILSPKSST